MNGHRDISDLRDRIAPSRNADPHDEAKARLFSRVHRGKPCLASADLLIKRRKRRSVPSLGADALKNPFDPERVRAKTFEWGAEKQHGNQESAPR